MKTSMLVFAILVNTPTAFADNSWASLQGCYVTEQRNGAAVDSNEAAVYTDTIKLEEDAFMGLVNDASDHPIPTLGFYIFQKYSAPDTSAFYDYKGAFNSLGTYSSDAGGAHFIFDGKLLYKSDQTQSFTLHETIDVVRLDPQRIGLHTVQTVVEVADGSMNTDDTYIIRKITCASADKFNKF